MTEYSQWAKAGESSTVLTVTFTAPYQRPVYCGVGGIVFFWCQLFREFSLMGEMGYFNFHPRFTFLCFVEAGYDEDGTQ